jgi:hypothetical protein
LAGVKTPIAAAYAIDIDASTTARRITASRTSFIATHYKEDNMKKDYWL